MVSAILSRKFIKQMLTYMEFSGRFRLNMFQLYLDFDPELQYHVVSVDY
jgi:hypothetical protein